MAVATIALFGLLIFYAIAFVAVLTIVRKKFGIKYALMVIGIALLAGLIYSVWIGNWLLAATMVLLGVGIRKHASRLAALAKRS
ncbi:hypothetical protein [Paenibacillus ginsengarvi]|uniref:Uncharacterized protein n=1 Tax=Paenibacillus ginsengarvi TaxID=400777 RepID=A0A3B0BEZ4_9BACL|nr:hypothetical protein [Paenibacillus ginsengarvi]RKN71222.1 hypothetical protein D7M11_29450 [Paenibacillus ginsengarvi]